jgi:hypothetical protein
MIFFDFTYYLLFRVYSAFNEKGAESSASAVVGGLQAFNVLTVLLIISLCFHKNIGVNVLAGILLFLAFQVFNYIRYFYISLFSITEIEIEWGKKSELYRRRFKYACGFYVILSVVSMVGLAVYFSCQSI